MTSETSDPHVSIVIPVFNEAGILHDVVVSLVRQLDDLAWTYQVILAENGSTDDTIAIGEALAAELPGVTMLSGGEPNYGRALREGILHATGRYVICDEIDLIDLDFYHRAMALLESDQADMVIGSKAMEGAHDTRPMLRRLATRVINGMLRVAVDFHGTDTHGLKAFHRDRLVPVVQSCVVDKDLFASEFVIRAGRAGLRVVDIPVEVAEKRRPAINLLRRVPHVLTDLAKLTYVIRFKKG